ncbi:hypothetical protein RU58_00039 [Achromobacter phage phiAxp-1]|uniref:terminase small subunit n=1 Tax=Achromobacter phage phiAxp-1 TaxID=1610509 RepID=UPI0006557635|nr:terminase small subunit [Achromobacter phage phiAxp-1]AKJ71364.1 hypothetical protein RU58_00039 [Achromobacter phage phiAxp-1]WNO48648.1 hypothetical protein [Achromobacter phage shaaii_LB5]
MSAKHLDQSLRAAFAAHFVRTADYMEAGALTYPDDGELAMMAAVQWQMDDWVKAEVERLKAEGRDLPTKVDLQRQLWGKMDTLQGDDYLKAAKLFAEIAGFIEKPAAVQVNNQTKIVAPRMIHAPNFNMDEWQAQAAKQQKDSLEYADSLKK